MKTITVPETILLHDSNGLPVLDRDGNPVSVSFKQFVTGTLLVDPKFGKTMADILSAVEIKRKVADATDKLELDNSDWEKLNAVAAEPSAGYNPGVVVQLVSFLTAIKDAK